MLLNQSLIQAIYTALNGNVTWNNISVPVYTMPQFTESYPYVLIHGIDVVDDSDKCNFMYDASFIIEVITSVNTRNYTILPSMGITQAVHDILLQNVKSVLNLGVNFKMINLVLENDSEIREQDETEIIIRRLLRFSTKVEKL